ncbi:odorant receptor 13a [Diachasma alloeum]|uniref:Odorant receptor n=1 Tax=Diachasma alloeum TaxID=454923 RepID=A0A4E0RNV7_9HYME|nr:odorant receptor 13a [Diachasma alloeum]THK33106.1 odorant receptor 86 [Diachasma alloeum]
MDALVVYTISAVLGAIGFTTVDVFKCVNDIEKFTYSSMNLITVLFCLYKVVSFALKRRQFLDLIRYAKKHFWYIEYEEYGAAVMNECMRRLTGIVAFAIFMCHLTISIHYIRPLLENRGRNGSDREFPFRLYSNLPIKVSPWYEILYLAQIFSTWPCCYTYFCFDNFLCQMNITATGQFVILQKELREICDKRNESTVVNEIHVRSRFVRCIRRHQQLIAFVEDIKELYRSVMLGVVILLSFLICMEMVQLMTSSSSSALSTFHYCVYVGGSITQLYFYTMSCDNLTGASLAISDAAYDVRWFIIKSGASKNQFVKDLSMVIMRSQRACTLTVGGFAPVTLQTFTSICHTAFSFLALVRQTLRDNEQ